jgi:hypothetical protein
MTRDQVIAVAHRAAGVIVEVLLELSARVQELEHKVALPTRDSSNSPRPPSSDISLGSVCSLHQEVSQACELPCVELRQVCWADIIFPIGEWEKNPHLSGEDFSRLAGPKAGSIRFNRRLVDRLMNQLA